MKLKDKCIVTTLGEESLLVMIGDEASTHRVIRLNDTADSRKERAVFSRSTEKSGSSRRLKKACPENVYGCKTVGVDSEIDPPKNAECCKTAGR